MNYLSWLLGISLAFVALEAWWPQRREQPKIRRGLLLDLFYLLWNGHFYAVVAAVAVGWCVAQTQRGLDAVGVLPAQGLLDSRPAWLQFAVFLLVSDFLQWCVHNLLHRVPWLWHFHQIHHSVTTMDWAANFRFHWMEIVIYRSLLYVPTMFMGGDGPVVFWVAVFATVWGHFNHSNVRLSSWGRLAMSSTARGCTFGITISPRKGERPRTSASY